MEIPLDKAVAVERLGGDENLFREFARSVLEEVPNLLANLRCALAESRLDDAHRTAHGLKGMLAAHLRETEGHEWLIRERLEARGATPSKAKDAALRIGGIGVGGFFGGQPDTAQKLASFAFAFEHLEIAAYELLRRVAERAADAETAAAAERILAEEQSAAAKLAATWRRTHPSHA